MLHESDLEQKINVTDVDINFESIYEKDYIPQKYIEEIKQANVLIIPNEGFRLKKVYSSLNVHPNFINF